jgi:probable rRNA maturation factor
MIEIVIDDEAWTADLPDAEGLARTAAVAAAPKDAALVVLLSGDEVLAGLNQRFRGIAKPTNVLSFPAGPGAGYLGDIAVAHGVCAAEARDQGKSLAAHLQHLVAHGVLHLVGYDHEDDADADIMEARERDILASLGRADPYG